ncbi:hypothetical protein I8H84_03425 [Candidatus Saccharibacteria bacterium]|nr:hypothetical protein [Candidatus Saccharibacteria bacterium]MBH1972996.1 hypothetical protein [Candidatus Saccharibacteria bacterium]MBH1991199.1 hypothetical protein [Candidatus Saccharibacteria bacterium]
MKSIKYIIYRENGTLCGLSIKDEKVDETDPNRIILPLYPRSTGEVEKLDVSEYLVRGNNNNKLYTIIDIDRDPKEPQIFVKESTKQS